MKHLDERVVGWSLDVRYAGITVYSSTMDIRTVICKDIFGVVIDQKVTAIIKCY